MAIALTSLISKFIIYRLFSYHITNILQKLGVSDRTQAVVTAFQRGIANL